VDPANPAQATLNRDLRWLVLTLQGVIALVFGGVGFGLLFGARYGAGGHVVCTALESHLAASRHFLARRAGQGQLARDYRPLRGSIRVVAEVLGGR
jgi:hypothetical protein